MPPKVPPRSAFDAKPGDDDVVEEDLDMNSEQQHDQNQNNNNDHNHHSTSRHSDNSGLNHIDGNRRRSSLGFPHGGFLATPSSTPVSNTTPANDASPFARPNNSKLLPPLDDPQASKGAPRDDNINDNIDILSRNQQKMKKNKELSNLMNNRNDDDDDDDEHERHALRDSTDSNSMSTVSVKGKRTFNGHGTTNETNQTVFSQIGLPSRPVSASASAGVVTPRKNRPYITNNEVRAANVNIRSMDSGVDQGVLEPIFPIESHDPGRQDLSFSASFEAQIAKHQLYKQFKREQAVHHDEALQAFAKDTRHHLPNQQARFSASTRPQQQQTQEVPDENNDSSPSPTKSLKRKSSVVTWTDDPNSNNNNNTIQKANGSTTNHPESRKIHHRPNGDDDDDNDDGNNNIDFGLSNSNNTSNPYESSKTFAPSLSTTNNSSTWNPAKQQSSSKDSKSKKSYAKKRSSVYDDEIYFRQNGANDDDNGNDEENNHDNNNNFSDPEDTSSSSSSSSSSTYNPLRQKEKYSDFINDRKKSSDDNNQKQNKRPPAAETTDRNGNVAFGDHDLCLPEEGVNNAVDPKKGKSHFAKRIRHPLRPRLVIDEDGGTDDERIYDDNNINANVAMFSLNGSQMQHDQQRERQRSLRESMNKKTNNDDIINQKRKTSDHQSTGRTTTTTNLPIAFIQQQLVREIRHTSVRTEFILYVLFVLVFFMVGYSPYMYFFSTESAAASANTFQFTETIRRSLVSGGSASQGAVENFHQFQAWANGTLIPQIWPASTSSTSSFSSSSPTPIRGKYRFTFLGTMRVRILNVKNDSCMKTSSSQRPCYSNFLSSTNVNRTTSSSSSSSSSSSTTATTTTITRNPSLPGAPLAVFQQFTQDDDSDLLFPNIHLKKIRQTMSPSILLFGGVFKTNVNQYHMDGGFTTFLPFNSTQDKVAETIQQLINRGFLDDGLSTRFVSFEWFMQVHNSQEQIAAKVFFEVTSGGLWQGTANFLPFLAIGGFGGGVKEEQVATVRSSIWFNVLLFSFLALIVLSYVRFFYDWVRVFTLARFTLENGSSSNSNGVLVGDEIAGNPNGSKANSNNTFSGGSMRRKFATRTGWDDDAFDPEDNVDDEENNNNNNNFDMRDNSYYYQNLSENAEILLAELKEEEENRLKSSASARNQNKKSETKPDILEDEASKERKRINDQRDKNEENVTIIPTVLTTTTTPQQQQTESSSFSHLLYRAANQAKIALAFFFTPWNLVEFLSLLFCLGIFITRIVSMSIVDSQSGDARSKIYQIALFVNPTISAAAAATASSSSTTNERMMIFDYGYPDVLDIVVVLFTIDRILGGVTAILILFKFLKYFGGKGNEKNFVLSTVYNTLASCKSHLLSLVLLYLILIFSFSLAAHVAFGSRVDRVHSSSVATDSYGSFRTLGTSFYSMFLQSLQLVGGGIAGASASGVAVGLFSAATSNNDDPSSFDSDQDSFDSFAWIFFVVFTVCVNFVLVNCFIAVLSAAFSTTVRSRRHDQGHLPLSSTAKTILWDNYLLPIVSSFSRQHASAAKKYFSLRVDGKSYQKLLVVLLKYVRERSEFVQKRQSEEFKNKSEKYLAENQNDDVDDNNQDDETDNQNGIKNKKRNKLRSKKIDDDENGDHAMTTSNGNTTISSLTNPFEMLDWLPEELVLSLVPPSVSSTSHYKFGGASSNESFEEENNISVIKNHDNDNDDEENDNNKNNSSFNGHNPFRNKNILKINVSRWEEGSFSAIPQDDYYLLLWKKWNSDLVCQMESEKRRELLRLKKNVYRCCSEEFN